MFFSVRNILEIISIQVEEIESQTHLKLCSPHFDLPPEKLSRVNVIILSDGLTTSPGIIPSRGQRSETKIQAGV